MQLANLSGPLKGRCLYKALNRAYSSLRLKAEVLTEWEQYKYDPIFLNKGQFDLGVSRILRKLVAVSGMNEVSLQWRHPLGS